MDGGEAGSEGGAPSARWRVPSNAFGLAEAVVGLAAGFVLASILVSIVGGLVHGPGGGADKLATDVASLGGLWVGFVGGAVVASRRREAAGTRPRRPVSSALAEDFGLSIRWWPDLPLGVAVGVACQYLLVPALELPLLPFVPDLFHRLGGPAKQLTGGQHGAALAVLGVLVCLGSPLVEELFFRGLLFRSLTGRLAGLGPRLGPVLATVVTGVVFGLVHFEALQLTALAGFGMVLCVLAWRTGRLGPGIVAHAAFNTTTFLAIALSH